MAFTKIIKWAQKNQLSYKLTTTHNGLPRLTITVSDALSFIIENRESEVYRSRRTGKLKGSRKGMYLEVQYDGKPGSDIYYSTQQDIITTIGYKIR